MGTKLLTANELAKILRVTKKTVYKYIDKGILTPVPSETGKHLFRESDISKILDNKEPLKSLRDIFNSDAFRLHSLLKIMDKVHVARRESFINGEMKTALVDYPLNPSSIKNLVDGLIGFDFQSFVLSDHDIIKQNLYAVMEEIKYHIGNNTIIIISNSATKGIIRKQGTTIIQGFSIADIIAQFEVYASNGYEPRQTAAVVSSNDNRVGHFVKADKERFQKMDRKQLEEHRTTIGNNKALTGNSKYR